MKKVLTTIVAVMMISVMFVGCIGYDSDAVVYHGLTPIHFTNDELTDSRQFTVNEGEYVGYKYQMKIYASNADTFDEGDLLLTVDAPKGNQRGDIQEITNIGVGDLSIDLNDSYPDIGTYSIKVHRPANGQYTLYIKITMEIEIGTQKVVLDPLYYEMPITVGDSSSSVLEFGSMDGFTVGKYEKKRIGIVIQSGAASVDAYHWYATNLPNGLSMSEDGYVSGIPEIAGVYDVKVFASEHNDGAVKYGNLRITVESAVNNPTNFDFRVSGGVSGNQINCFDYVAIEGNKVKVELLNENSSDPITGIVANPDDDIYVSTVKENGNTFIYTNVEFENGACILDTTGSGCYKVNISYDHRITTFHLYVIPAFDIVEAQIMISSS